MIFNVSMFLSLESLRKQQRERCQHTDTLEGRMTRFARIEVLLAIAAAIFVFLGVFGSFRRRCSNSAFTSVTFTAYALSSPIVAYTLGLIQSTPFCSLLLPFWATLVMVLGGVDSYTAHSMEDIERWKSINADSAAKCLAISLMIVSYMFFWWPMFALFFILFMKIEDRARALKFASNSVMQKNYKLLADYMSTEHQWSDSSDEDPATMYGYKYLVRMEEETKVPSLFSTAIWRQKAAPWLDGEAPHYRQSLKTTDEVITIEKVHNCKGRLLSASGGDPNGQLKDLCLSFSLFKFICLRFAGYSLPREAHNKLWRLIRHMLSEENGHERVFRVIEVELALLFDLFYTNYPVNLNPLRSVYRLLLLPLVVAATLMSMYFGAMPWLGKAEDQPENLVMVNGPRVPYLLMVSIIIIEFAQFGIMIFSEWAKVTYICKYVRNEWWQRNRCVERLIEIMCRVWLLKPWGRQLRQYSLLESCYYSPWKCVYNRLTAAYLDPNRKGQKEIAPCNLSKQVTKAIAQSLRKKNCTDHLEKGQASLRLNDVFDELSWACNLETTSHIIMVWHIATTFCEHEAPLRGPQCSQEHRDNFGIATTLSKYLAYLVAFAPRLLPGHPCRTEYLFDRAVGEANRLFEGSSVSMGERIQKLKIVADNEETIVGRGVRLGKQLASGAADEERIWKVLADFWAEMMLYVAPSNDAAAHAMYLSRGGEFVTHVWVLVSHVGIARDPLGSEGNDYPERD